MPELNCKIKTDSFNTSLTKLESVVEKMEQDNLSLEDSLEAFETGLHIIRQTQKTLAVAEQKVELLTETNGEINHADIEQNTIKK